MASLYTQGTHVTDSNFTNNVVFFLFGMIVRAFTNDPGDRGSMLGQVIPKTQKMVLDAALINTQH